MREKTGVSVMSDEAWAKEAVARMLEKVRKLCVLEYLRLLREIGP